MLIFGLLILLERFVDRTEEAHLQRWNDIANVAHDTFASVPPGSFGELESKMVSVRGRFNVSRIEIELPSRQVLSSGLRTTGPTEVVQRNGHYGTTRLIFDSSAVAGVGRTFMAVTGIVVVASITGLLL